MDALPQPIFIVLVSCQTSLFLFFPDTVSQHCSTVAKGWISLNVCPFEREKERDHEWGVTEMKMKSQHVRAAATCSTDIAITSMLQRERKL